MDAFTLETAEEVFGNSVVVGVALAGHALAEAKIREVLAESTSSILDAAVRVEDEAFGRAVASHSHVKRGEGKVCVNAVRESEPFPVNWTAKRVKKRNETQDISAEHVQAAWDGVRERAKASGASQPIEE